MNKMRLSLDRLAVESFATGQVPEEATGTVHGAMATSTGNCATCKGATCFTSCAGAGAYPVCTCPIPA
ncbi:MAG TPA: hypothetical protein VF771_00910 [Longimicrobiaceae bacterium]